MGILVDLNDDETERLSLRASEHGRSIEEEAEKILKDSLQQTISGPSDRTNLFDQIRADVEKFGGGFEIEPLPRHRIRNWPDFSGPEFDHLNKDDRS